MAIQCRAEQTSDGAVMSGIGVQADAENLRTFLAELGLKTSLGPPLEGNDYTVVLTGISLEALCDLVEGTKIDLAT